MTDKITRFSNWMILLILFGYASQQLQGPYRHMSSGGIVNFNQSLYFKGMSINFKDQSSGNTVIFKVVSAGNMPEDVYI